MNIKKVSSNNSNVISRYVSNDSAWIIDLVECEKNQYCRCTYLHVETQIGKSTLYPTILKIFKVLPEETNLEVLKALLGDSLSETKAQDILADLIIGSL
jgi:hypothetical protein